MTTRFLFLPLLACSLFASGCGSTLVPVSGSVVFPDGEPVMSGIIEWSPLDGGGAVRATLASDGSFTLRTAKVNGVKPGVYRVVVVQFASAEGFPGHVRPHHKATRVVHPRYGEYETARLQRVVEGGRNNVFRIEVEPSR